MARLADLEAPGLKDKGVSRRSWTGAFEPVDD